MSPIHLYIYLLTLCFPSIQKPGLLTKAGDTLIQIECHNASAPKACVQCLKSDNRSLNADKYTIATLVIECLNKHANSLAGIMPVLASRISQQNGSRKAYEDCGQLFMKATKLLEFVAKEITNRDYDNADRFMFSARMCNLECYGNVGNVDESIIGVSFDVRSEMMVFEELSEAAMRIIERF